MKIILVSHGEFTTYLLKSAEMILGDQKENSVVSIKFYAKDSMETLKNRVAEVLDKFKDEELLILTDLKGGTPCNVSFLLSKQYKLRLITGVNLPMLLESLLSIEENLTDELIKTIIKAGIDGVQSII